MELSREKLRDRKLAITLAALSTLALVACNGSEPENEAIATIEAEAERMRQQTYPQPEINSGNPTGNSPPPTQATVYRIPESQFPTPTPTYEDPDRDDDGLENLYDSAPDNPDRDGDGKKDGYDPDPDHRNDSNNEFGDENPYIDDLDEDNDEVPDSIDQDTEEN